MKKYSRSVCKKDLSKLNTRGLFFNFEKDKKYDFEILNIDSGNFCAFFYILAYDSKCKILESEFKDYFHSESELRKIKLNKIKNELSI